jgi:hypothetical protein
LRLSIHHNTTLKSTRRSATLWLAAWSIGIAAVTFFSNWHLVQARRRQHPPLLAG